MKRDKTRTHERLGITFAEFGALLGTRALLAEGYLTHVPVKFGRVVKPIEGAHAFNMSLGCSNTDMGACGSVSCIGGTMALLMGYNISAADDYVRGDHAERGTHSMSLYELFFPLASVPYGPEYSNITIPQTIKAIDNFIKYGDAKWARVLGIKRKVK